MCCGSTDRLRSHHHGNCGCMPPGRSGPMCVWTKQEQATYLKQHVQDLRDEIKAVEERIAELTEGE